jgi:tRNA 2-(methylsulfanyl)-N6-isopentenyladenosine37 hydroxylase
MYMSSSKVSILGLKLPSDPRWVNLAAISLEEVLTDHAFCEQKAATSCISLIQRYPDRERLVTELAPIVEMRKRGFPLGKQRKDEYVNQLKQHERKGGHPEDVLLDRLLIFALIEARSCERFRLLSEGLEDKYLREFYYKFMVSEAGHYRLFIDLANEYINEEKVRNRWQELLKIEAEVIENLSVRGDRIH